MEAHVRQVEGFHDWRKAMNWRRGLFRVWFVLAALWVVVAALACATNLNDVLAVADGVPRVFSQGDYDSLPFGSGVIDPEGKHRTKSWHAGSERAPA